jgi:hypothetical protein
MHHTKLHPTILGTYLETSKQKTITFHHIAIMVDVVHCVHLFTVDLMTLSATQPTVSVYWMTGRGKAVPVLN